jgi:hypothetical protein
MSHYVRDYLIARWGKEIAEKIRTLDVQRWLKSLHNDNGLALDYRSENSKHHVLDLHDWNRPREGVQKTHRKGRDPFDVQLQGNYDHARSDHGNPWKVRTQSAAIHSLTCLRRNGFEGFGRDAGGSRSVPRGDGDENDPIVVAVGWFVRSHNGAINSVTLLECMAGTTGLEPATSAVTGQRSDQLSYVPRLFFNNLVIRHIESSVS